MISIQPIIFAGYFKRSNQEILTGSLSIVIIDLMYGVAISGQDKTIANSVVNNQ